MSVLKNDMRYETLAKQFFSSNINKELKESNQRIFSYLYHQTNIYYLEDLGEETLYHYIHFHLSESLPKTSICVLIKDVKNFLFYLEKIINMDEIPKVDLSITNIRLWTAIGK